MRVEIITNFSCLELERDINDFIEEKEVLDIKFVASGLSHTAMIIYKD